MFADNERLLRHVQAHAPRIHASMFGAFDNSVLMQVATGDAILPQPLSFCRCFSQFRTIPLSWEGDASIGLVYRDGEREGVRAFVQAAQAFFQGG